MAVVTLAPIQGFINAVVRSCDELGYLAMIDAAIYQELNTVLSLTFYLFRFTSVPDGFDGPETRNEWQ
jgi:hypothetical protein